MKQKKIKTKNTTKTIGEKISEIKTIYNKLEQVGLNKTHPDIRKFHTIVNDYIKSNESFSGKLRIHGADRILQYILPKSTKNECQIMLKYSRE